MLAVDDRATASGTRSCATAALRLATPAQRREAHRALAASLPADAPGPGLAPGRGEPSDPTTSSPTSWPGSPTATGCGWATRPHRRRSSAPRVLTQDPAKAAERLAAAAEDAFVAGDVDRTRALVDRVLAGPAADSARGRALFTLGMLEQYAGSVPRAADHLAAACAVLDGEPLVRALTELAHGPVPAQRLRRPSPSAPSGSPTAADLGDPEQRLPALFIGGVARALVGDYESAIARCWPRSPTWPCPRSSRHDPRALLLMALAPASAATVGEVMARGASRVDDLRRRGAVGVLVPILAIIAAGRAWLGDHAGAFADAGEAAELAEHLGYAADAAVAVEMLAWQSAARGLHDEAREALARARVLIDRAGTTSVAAHHALTAAFCALCRGDLAEVVDAARGADRRRRRAWARWASPSAWRRCWSRPTSASAAPTTRSSWPAVRRGHSRLGPRTDRRARAPLPGPHRPRRRRPLSGVREGALAAHAEAPTRSRRPAPACCTAPGSAATASASPRASSYASPTTPSPGWTSPTGRTQAAAELAATGATARPRGAGPEEPLTSQETRVALLVAEGRSNKEVAAALFLSPKTIEHHLGSVFRKRGFKSRTELARAYAAPRRAEAADIGKLNALTCPRCRSPSTAWSGVGGVVNRAFGR